MSDLGKNKRMHAAYTCSISDDLAKSTWVESDMTLEQLEKWTHWDSQEHLVSRESWKRMWISQHSFNNSDITTLTSSSSCAPVGQRHMGADRQKGRTWTLTLSWHINFTYNHMTHIQMKPAAGTFRSVKKVKSDSNDYRFQWDRSPQRRDGLAYIFFSP